MKERLRGTQKWPIENKRQKRKNNIRVALKNDREKTPHIPKMPQFLKGGKNGYFAKATAKQTAHKWSILGLSLKLPKTYRNYPLKSLELFYAENCSKTHLRTVPTKVQKKTLQSHDSYSTPKNRSNTNLIFEKWHAFEKWQNWPFCKGYSKAKSSKLTYLVAEF